MGILENFATGLSSLASIDVLLALALGVFIGLFFGVMPGLSATMGVALLAPFTFPLEPLVAIPFLIGVYRGGLYGGVIPAVLIGVPGTASNVPTMLDGYELAKKGYPLTALRCSLYSSVFGSLLAALVLVSVIEEVARVALRIGSPELFALLALSMTLVSFVSGQTLSKGIFAAALGMFVGLIGLDPITGGTRFTLGLSELRAGVSIIPMFVGLFAVSEMALLVERTRRGQGSLTMTEVGHSREDRISWLTVIRRYWRTILGGSVIGSFVGTLPGVGSETSPWLSYGLAKRFSPRGDNFGKGEPEGVVACETANDAVASAAFVPTLVFGIPGDLPLAVMLGAFMAQGLRPGPRLFAEQPEIMFGIVVAVLASSFMLYIVVQPIQPLLSKIVRLPTWVLVPVIATLCVGGAFAVNNEPFDLYLFVFFGIVGIIMRKTDTPLAPFVLAFIIGPALERAFRESLMLRRGASVFFESPLSMALLAAAAAILLSTLISGIRRAARERTA